MKRRFFLFLGSATFLSTVVKAEGYKRKTEKQRKSAEKTIASVQQHLFPENSSLPSSRSMFMTRFLFDTILHASYDKDIRAFVIEGAEELEKREKGKFILLSAEKKERALRAYEATSYGSSWLSRIMVLSMEALFSDPVYGSNRQEAGWKALNTYGGFPRPKTKYIEL